MSSSAPVVLLHCSGSSSAQWRSLAAHLAPDHEVIAPDLIGYGSAPPRNGRGGFRLAEEAAPVRSILGQLGRPVHLVGHSYGGAVALHLARTRPERIRSLTLIEPVAFHLLKGGDSEDAFALREIEEVALGVAAALVKRDLHEGFGRFIDYWSGPGAWTGVPSGKRAALAPLLGKVSLDFEAVLNEPARLEDLLDIRAPTLILQGGDSPLPARRICEHLSAVIRGAQLRVVAGGGHMLPLTHSHEVNGLIAAHVARHAQADGRGESTLMRELARNLLAFVRREWIRCMQRREARATRELLRILDARALRDIGLDRSEIDSVATELADAVERTRRRCQGHAAAARDQLDELAAEAAFKNRDSPAPHPADVPSDGRARPSRS